MTTPRADQPDQVTYREVKELLRTFAASDWAGLTLRVDGMTITAGRHGPPAGTVPPAAVASAAPAVAAPPAAQADPAPVAAPPAAGRRDHSGWEPVRSPAVGAFWVAPQPGAAPFAEVGQAVGEGEQLAIVEVMKLMNTVLAPLAGEIAEVCAANGELVEYEQVLFWIRPSAPPEPAGG